MQSLYYTWQKKVIFLGAEVGAKKRKVSGISMMKVASTLSLCIHSGWRLAAYLESERDFSIIFGDD